MKTMRELHCDTLPMRLPLRPDACHKGDFGAVAIIGGAPGMAGAALLAARAALYAGAGRVYAGLIDPRIGLDPATPELMVCAPQDLPPLSPPACVVLGPGLGQSETAQRLLHDWLDCAHPLLLDADALNLVAHDPRLRQRLAQRGNPSLLTPHPGEAGRLLGLSSQAVQADRTMAVRRLAEEFAAVAVLKGAGTLVMNPGGEIWRNRSGNPGMAAPGMGDVLAGVIAGLIAQGLPALEAALHGVWLHGAAADLAVAEGCGPRGLLASELLSRVRRLNQTPLAGKDACATKAAV